MRAPMAIVLVLLAALPATAADYGDRAEAAADRAEAAAARAEAAAERMEKMVERLERMIDKMEESQRPRSSRSHESR